MTAQITPAAEVATPASTVADPPADNAPRRGGGRLQFLDALRGVAGTSVLCQHAAENLWPNYARFSHETFRPGEFGVILFFICSGFIIPASVERHDSLGRFWIGRAFRLFPLYWAALIATVVLHYAFNRPMLSKSFVDRPQLSLLINTTMMQNFMETPLFNGATWSLAYEMVFYFLVSLLFLAGWHKRSVPIAVYGLLGAVIIGPYLPAIMVSEGNRQSYTTVAAATVLIAVLFVSRIGGGAWTKALAVLLTALIVPFLLNRGEPMWFAVLLLSSMFVGTVLYRWTIGEVSGRTAATVYGLAIVIVPIIHYANVKTHPGPHGAVITWRVEALTFLGAYLLFGGVLLLRHHRFPWLLTYLGAISYSVYLLHVVVLYAVPWWDDDKLATFCTWVGLTLALSVCTYHAIEKPAIQLGRRVEARFRRPEPEPVAS